MNIQTLLKEEVQDEIVKLGNMELGTEQHKAAVDGVTKLADRVIEMEKLDSEFEERKKAQAFENDLKLKQAKEEKIHRWVQVGLGVLGIAVPSMITVWGTKKSIQFEKDGTFTTIMGRGFINKLLPKK